MRNILLEFSVILPECQICHLKKLYLFFQLFFPFLYSQVLFCLHKNQHQEILDFIYQQQAKCLLELNQLEEAAIKFEAALRIRESKKDKRLIKATKLHLKFISELKSNNHQ